MPPTAQPTATTVKDSRLGEGRGDDGKKLAGTPLQTECSSLLWIWCQELSLQEREENIVTGVQRYCTEVALQEDGEVLDRNVTFPRDLVTKSVFSACLIAGIL